MVTVLLVEDNRHLRRLTKLVLETLPGVSVLAVSRVAEARDAARVHAPEVAIVDQRLPDGKGSDLVRELKTSCPNCRAVLMTGDLLVLAGETPGPGGPDHLLSKPFDPYRLLELVRNVRRPEPSTGGDDPRAHDVERSRK